MSVILAMMSSSAFASTKTPASLVPSSIRASGVLTDGINVGYPPFEYDSASNKIIGADIDLAGALAKELNLKLQLKNTGFTAIIPGIVSGRYDMGISAFTDTKVREGQVSFVDYLQDGTSALVSKGNHDALTIKNLCGKTVGVVTASSQLEVVVPLLNKACAAKGKAALKVLSFAQSDEPPVALQSGRIVAALVDTGNGAYIAKTSSQFQLAPGGQVTAQPVGAAVPRSGGIAKALQAALKVLIANGKYSAILKKWGLSSEAVKTVSINGAVS